MFTISAPSTRGAPTSDSRRDMHFCPNDSPEFEWGHQRMPLNSSCPLVLSRPIQRGIYEVATACLVSLPKQTVDASMRKLQS